MKTFFFLLICWVLVACEGDYGHRVIGNNLTVYYSSPADQKSAEQIALYWKENDLIADVKQDLQYVQVNGGHELRVIARESFNSKEMPFEERKLMLELQNELCEELNEENLQLVICNSKFETIYNINE